MLRLLAISRVTYGFDDRWVSMDKNQGETRYYRIKDQETGLRRWKKLIGQVRFRGNPTLDRFRVISIAIVPSNETLIIKLPGFFSNPVTMTYFTRNFLRFTVPSSTFFLPSTHSVSLHSNILLLDVVRSSTKHAVMAACMSSVTWRYFSVHYTAHTLLDIARRTQRTVFSLSEKLFSVY